MKFTLYAHEPKKNLYLTRKEPLGLSNPDNAMNNSIQFSTGTVFSIRVSYAAWLLQRTNLYKVNNVIWRLVLFSTCHINFFVYDKEHKLSQYGDDTFLILDGSASSLCNALDTLELFSKISGMLVSSSKTKYIWFGSKKIKNSSEVFRVPTLVRTSGKRSVACQGACSPRNI